MISKELLSEVLGIYTIQMNPILEGNNMVGYLVYGPHETPTQVRQNHKQINIHEIAHKCKEWAYLLSKKRELELHSYVSGNRSYCLAQTRNNTWGCIDKTFKANTEPEAIFKACQYIMENGR